MWKEKVTLARKKILSNSTFGDGGKHKKLRRQQDKWLQILGAINFASGRSPRGDVIPNGEQPAPPPRFYWPGLGGQSGPWKGPGMAPGWITHLGVRTLQQKEEDSVYLHAVGCCSKNYSSWHMIAVTWLAALSELKKTTTKQNPNQKNPPTMTPKQSSRKILVTFNLVT